jgi:hypothetical protein
LAKGRADLGFYWNFALFLFVPLVIYIGSYWGLKGVALAQVLLMIILMVPGWFYLVKPLCGAGLREYVSSFGKPLSYVLVAGCAVIPFTLIQNMLLQTVATLIVGACIYMVFIWKFNKDFLMLAKELAPFKLRV